uniref:Putative cullin 4B n=1 Tax=Trypanosoma congolense (strain IL3000) TaxID=1068625 RepID=G0UJT1_TRYCI|nr:putative cullin 4B [Trypanosoma congolense IL3000]
MTSRAVHNWSGSHSQWDEQLRHTKPCIRVQLHQHDPAQHLEACAAEGRKALEVAMRMLDAVLSRAGKHTKSIIELPGFEDKSFQLLQNLLVLSTPSMPSPELSSAFTNASSLPTPAQQRRIQINFCGREYFVDSTCRSVRTLVELDSAPLLFQELEQRLVHYVENLVEMLCSGVDPDTDARVIFMRLVHAWGHFYLAVVELREVWVFFDRWYVFKIGQVKSIEGLAILILRGKLLQHPWILPRAEAGYLECLLQDLVNYASRNTDAVGNSDCHKRRHELRLFTDLYVAMQLYFSQMESQVVAVVTKFCTEEAERMWINELPAEDFFARVDQLLQQNQERVRSCLVPHSLPALEGATLKSLLLSHGIDVIKRDFARIAMEKHYDCFRLAWRLLADGKYVRLGKEFGAAFRGYVLQEGLAIMQKLTLKPPEGEMFGVVKAMINLTYCGESVISGGFPEERNAFSLQLRAALSEALQHQPAEFGEQLARYLDWVMRESGENTTFEQSETNSSKNDVGNISATSRDGMLGGTESLLKDISDICALFPSKDVFEGIYWRDLTRRLLHHPRGAPRVDMEGYFIRLLREACGMESTRYEGMVNDLVASQELNERFHSLVTGEGCNAVMMLHSGKRASDNEEEERDEHLGEEPRRTPVGDAGDENKEEGKEREEFDRELLGNALATVDVRLNILTESYWPEQTQLQITLPIQLRALARCVDKFYRHCFADRRLVWQHQLSSAVIKSTVGGSKRQLSGTLVQAAILLTLQEFMATEKNPDDLCVSVGAVCGRLGLDISLPDVIAAILGLCHPKFRLLVRTRSSGISNETRDDIGTSEGAGGARDCSVAGIAASPLLETDGLQVNSRFAVAAQFSRIPFPGGRRRGDVFSSTMDDKYADNNMTQTSDGTMKEQMHIIETAVVRFMKERRLAAHDEVLAAVPTMVRFPITASAVKEAIRQVTERGFLERHGATEYIYVP